jgi:hypothetical protein
LAFSSSWRPQLVSDRRQGADARRERVPIAVDDAVELAEQRGGFFVVQVNVHDHGANFRRVLIHSGRGGGAPVLKFDGGRAVLSPFVPERIVCSGLEAGVMLSCPPSFRPVAGRLGPNLGPSTAYLGTAMWRAPTGTDRWFPVSDTAMRRLCRQIAGFRDWCAENGVSRDLAEAALAHAIKDKTEAAYNRTSMIEQRREVMERWAAFAHGP